MNGTNARLYELAPLNVTIAEYARQRRNAIRIYAMCALAAIGLALGIGIRIGESTAPAVPSCQEDEVMAARPFPEGEIICIHIDEL